MELHPQLQQDTCRIGKLELCHCLLMNDARYPWIILVPDLEDTREIYQLNQTQRNLLMEESCLIQQMMMQQFQPEKLNVGALGNIVPQLHLHHIARQLGDPAWPGPVWGHSPAQPYEDSEVTLRIEQIQGALRL